MKTITVSQEFFDAAMELGNYIDESDSEYEDLKQFIKDGNDPKDHVLYKAAIVVGFDDSLQEYIDEIKEQIEEEDF
jgi:hypothetical protein